MISTFGFWYSISLVAAQSTVKKLSDELALNESLRFDLEKSVENQKIAAERQTKERKAQADLNHQRSNQENLTKGKLKYRDLSN